MLIKSFALRLASWIVAIAMLIPVGINRTDPYDVRDPEGCKMNFCVLSDAHIETNNYTRYRVFARSLQNLKKNLSGHDAVVFLGDSTMNGQLLENMIFHGTASLLLRGETVLPVLGNHDVGNGEGDYEKLQNRWYDFTAACFDRELEHPYYYEIVDGCYFIVLGMESHEVHDLYISEAQYAWLDGVLEAAGKTGKPTFVFCHQPTDYAVDADGSETERLVKTLAAFNEEHDLFAFVGHTHMPLYLFWSFHSDDGYPETYLPRLTSLGGEKDDEVYDNTGIGVEVEVYESEVVIRGRNFYSGQWRTETDDDTGEEVPCEAVYPLLHSAF